MRKSLVKILAVILVVVTVFGTMTVAMAITENTYTRNYSISNLAANGGVLYSSKTIEKTTGHHYGYCRAQSFGGGEITCRIYDTSEDYNYGKSMNYLSIPRPVYKYEPFYTPDSTNNASNYSFWARAWEGKMKFSNDSSTRTITSGYWGSSATTSN